MANNFLTRQRRHPCLPPWSTVDIFDYGRSEVDESNYKDHVAGNDYTAAQPPATTHYNLYLQIPARFRLLVAITKNLKAMKNKILILFAMGSMALSSCKKEGCTDSTASNYDAKAKKNAGCTFEGQVTFWYNEATAEALIADEAVALTYHLDGQLIGSSAASVYYTGAPDCDQQGTVSTTKSLGAAKTKVCTYKITDQTGHVYWEGQLIITGGQCLAQELTW